jgi:8-amino-7-oxononanoate synthase
VFPHLDADALAGLLAGHGGGSQVFVVTESLFSMDGDVAPLARYAALCRAHGAALVVDEAHAVGVFGTRGSGLLEAAGLGTTDAEGTDPDEDAEPLVVSVNTAGKALGVAGAFVSGPAVAIDSLIQRARPFVFSTAPPPPLTAALEAALDIVAAEPERRARLAALAAHLRARLAASRLRVPDGVSHIVPVVIGDNARTMAAAAALQARGFDVRGIRPPSVAPGTARLRISVNIGVEERDLDRLAAELAALPELRS